MDGHSFLAASSRRATLVSTGRLDAVVIPWLIACSAFWQSLKILNLFHSDLRPTPSRTA